MSTTTSMIAPLAAFTEDIAGLEKSLRLAQGLCMVGAGVIDSAEDRAIWARAGAHFAICQCATRPPVMRPG